MIACVVFQHCSHHEGDVDDPKLTKLYLNMLPSTPTAEVPVAPSVTVLPSEALTVHVTLSIAHIRWLVKSSYISHLLVTYDAVRPVVYVPPGVDVTQ